MLRRLSPATRFGLLMAGLSVVCKSLIVGYGLPLEFNPDEAYILKEPFKLTYQYSQGVFAYPTNLFFWIVQVWYALLFLVGRVVSHWDNVTAFRTLLVAEADQLILWGRLLGVLASAGAIYVLARVIVATTSGWWTRVLMTGSLALNPVDLVETPWLKFDGMVALLNAISVAAFVKYLHSNSTRDRQWLYLLAILTCSFRIDFVVFGVVLVLHDVVNRRPFSPVLRSSLVGVALYCLATLLPVVMVYRRAFPEMAARVMTVTSTFEGHILNRLASDWTTGRFWDNPGAGLEFYTPILASVGLPFVLIAARGVRRSRPAQLMLVLSIVTLGPMLISSAVATRYALPLSVYLLLAAGWAIERLGSGPVRIGLLLSCFLVAASLTLETTVAIHANTDPRIEAGRYLLSRSKPSDIIAVEDYINPGRHAEVAECPDELRKKAAATIESRSGTGETFAAWANRPAGDCRRVLELADTDRFERSSYRRRWINTYDPESLNRAGASLLTTNVRYTVASLQGRHPSFAQFVLLNYDLVRIFEPHYGDPRVGALLKGTPYFAQIYVYQRKF